MMRPMPLSPKRKQTRLLRRYRNEHSREMVVDGTRIHYRIEGQGPPLVLLHGVMASLHTWDGWVEALRKRYRILRVDLPGFGFSDDLPPEGYTPENSAAFFEKVTQTLGLERFLLAGNSLGGFLGWYYAAHYPHRVEKLALLSPIAYPQRLPGIIRFASTAGIGEIARYITPRSFVQRNVRQVFGDPSKVTEELVDRYYHLMMRGNNRRAMVRTFRALKAFNEDPNLADKVSQVTAPTLLMWGTKDRWVPPSLLKRWRSALPHAQVQLYEGLGHTPMEEDPRRTAEDAHAFFSTQAEASVPA